MNKCSSDIAETQQTHETAPEPAQVSGSTEASDRTRPQIGLDNPEERTKQELLILSEEFRVRTSDINLQVEIQQQVFALVIVGTGAILAAAPFIIQNQTAILFGLSSLVFYGLALTMLRHSWTIFANEAYITNFLAPEIDRCFGRLSPSSAGMDPGMIFGWSTGKSKLAYTQKWWQFPIEAARYLIPVVTGLACLVAFWLTPSPRIFWIDYGLLFLNIFWALYTIVTSLRLRASFLSQQFEVSRS